MIIVKTILHYLLGVAFIFAGLLHFGNPDFYVGIMPPYFPYPEELVAISGVCEIVAGILVMFPATARVGAWAVIAVLLGVFPANVHMALNPHEFDQVSRAFLYMRLPLQALALVWAFWFTIPQEKDEAPELTATETSETPDATA